jgi:acyl carrier protein
MTDPTFERITRVLEAMATRPDDISAEFVRAMSEITPRAISRLDEDLQMDDLDRVEFVMALENAFGILITDEASEEWVRLGDVVETVRKAQVSG